MMRDASWVGLIDHRISAAVVFFILLLMLNTAPKRKRFALSALLGLLLMCAGSWLVRTVADVLFTDLSLRGLGHSAQILLLFGLFWLTYRACYVVSDVEATYLSILALTIFKIAWDVFKTGSSLFLISDTAILWSLYSPFGSLVSYLVYLSVCLLCCGIYKHSVKEPTLHSPPRVLTTLAILFVFFQMILEYCGIVYTGDSNALFLYYFCALLYTILNFVALVMIAQLDSFRHENRNMHDFINNKMRYYEMSHDGIVALQTKCHDLKHQITAIRSEAGKARFNEYLDELEDSIDEYSTVIECGNQTVDIVLTEKNILCMSCGVKFSYMIDGSLFSFLTEREIYSLFGNALDNALEGTSRVPDEANRMISLKSNVRGNLVVLQIENTYAGEMTLVDGLPRTTKQETGHGFGLRSILRIAEKHGGGMSVRTESGIFKLSIFMQPGAAHM
jgi:hypothetical protein